MTRVQVHPDTETLATSVSRDVDDEECAFDIPEALVAAFERTAAHLDALSDIIVSITEGAGAVSVPDFPGGPAFGDPRMCWNPIRHTAHTHAYGVEGQIRTVLCDGSGEDAALLLGLHLARTRYTGTSPDQH